MAGEALDLVDAAAAAGQFESCLGRALELGFVPTSIEAMATSTPLLPDDVAEKVRACVAAHPATDFQVRRWLGLTGGGLAAGDEHRPATGYDSDAEHDRLALAGEVRRQLAGLDSRSMLH